MNSFLPDQFFTLAKQNRLGDLMNLFRTCRDNGIAMADADTAELESLVDEELPATGRRATKALRDRDK
jgi:hypothetical protein